MEHVPSPQELAEEALRALRDAPLTSREHFDLLVREGIIDESGRVLVARLFSDGAIRAESTPERSVRDLR